MDIDADSESEASDAQSMSDSELNDWRSFDEQEDQEVPISREDMIKELDEMLGPDEEAVLWDCSASSAQSRLYIDLTRNVDLRKRDFD